MERQQIERSFTPDLVELEGAEGRTLHARLMRWDVPSLVSDGGDPYDEIWRRGVFAQSIRRAQHLGRGWPLMYNHNKQGIPVGMVSMIHERDDGPWATAKISRTQDGNDMLELIADGVMGVSVSGLAIRSRKHQDGTIERMEVAVQEVSVTPWPSLIGSDELVLRGGAAHAEPTVEGSLADLQAFYDGIASQE